MLDTFLAVLGIAVSLILFIVGYRQTVGAKKERIAAANTEIEKILLRRVVLESYSPTRLDVDRITDGKARDFRVRPDDLLSTAQVLNALHTRIVESDLIPATERRAILDRITPALTESEAKPLEELESELNRGKRWASATSAVAVMAVLASSAGALVSAIPEIANLDSTHPALFKTFIATAAMSLGVITLFLFAYRLRSTQESVSTRGQEVEQYVRFERLVASSLRKLGFTVRPLSSHKAGDFLIELHGRKYLVEVRSWPRRVPSRVLTQLAERLKVSANELGADEAIVVTPAQLIDSAEAIQIPGVRFMVPKQLETLAQQNRNHVA